MPFTADRAPVVPGSKGRLARYLLAVAIVAGASLLRLAADPLLHDQVPYFIYVGSVVLATWSAGVGGGILATVIATFAGNYFFVPPRFQLSFRSEDVAAMSMFAALSFALVWTVGRWRRAEVRARLIQAETAAALNQMPVGVLIGDESGRIRFGNAAVEKVFGRLARPSSTVPEWRREADYQAFFPDGRPMGVDETPMARALRNGETVSAEELKIVRGNGSVRSLSAYAAPVKDANGRITAVVVAMVDITDQKAAAEALRQRAEELHTILDTVPAAIFMTRTSDASQMEGNKFTVDYLRLAAGSNVSLTAPEAERPPSFRVFKDGRELPGEELPVQSAIASGREVRDYEFDLVFPDGGLRTLFGNATPLRDEHGRARGAVGAFVDITERKRAEDAKREVEGRFRSVLDGSRDIIYRVNMETGRYEYISPSAEAVVGFSPSELMALDQASMDGLVHPEDLPGFRAAVSRLAQTGTEEAEYRQRTKGGAYRWLSNHMSLAKDARGRPAYRDGNIRDVTDQRRLNEALHATLEELEHANRVKDEFLATLSHELRTPLNAVLGWSEMLLRPGLPQAAERKALESINRNARAQTALIGDILDVSRIISGKLRLELRPVDLGEVLKAACESVQPAADAKAVQLRTKVEGRPTLTGDPDRLQQVLWNLLSNGVKFCRMGGRVDVVVGRADSHIRIAVSDDGEGIAPGLLPHVFERFRQGDSSTTRAQGGLGLGLAIVRHLVELHGGTVGAQSDGEGRGARFTITLPVRQPTAHSQPDVPAPANVPPAAAIEPGCLEGLRVVAVDDQEEARSLVQAALERYGARVTLCGSAHEALAALSLERPDVLVADIGMPAVDGYELIRLVRSLPDVGARAIPAIAVTAYGGDRDRAQAIRAGYSEHLAKPIIPDALVNIVALAAGRGNCG